MGSAENLTEFLTSQRASADYNNRDHLEITEMHSAQRDFFAAFHELSYGVAAVHLLQTKRWAT